MAGLAVADLASIAIEGVARDIPELTETQDDLNAIMKDNGKAIKVGEIAYRLPLWTSEVGGMQIVNLDSGSVPRGTSPSWDKGSITPIAWGVAWEWSELVKLTGTTADNLAVVKAVDRQIASGTKMVKVWRDVGYHTDGTGKMATLTGNSGGTVTLASTPFGARMLRKSQKVAIYNGTAYRGYMTIDQVPVARLGVQQTFHFTTSADDGGTGIASAQSGDFVRPYGVTDGAPVWVYGLPYFINTSNSGSLLGISKSAATDYVVSNGYDMGSAQISLPALRLLINQVKNRLGNKALKNQFFYTHETQVAAYEELGFPLQSIRSDGEFGNLNLLFKGKKAIDAYPIVTGQHADQASWYFLNPEAWGKAKYGDPPFFYQGTGGTVYPLYDGTTGTPKFVYGSCLIDAFQPYCTNVLAQGVISSCKVPGGSSY